MYTIHGLIPGDIEPGAKKHVRCSLQCYAPEDREILRNAFLHCEKTGDSYDFEFPFTPVKGDRIWVRTIAKPVLKDGRVIKIIGNIMDITDRKQMEDTLKESEKRYRILFQNLTIGFALHEIITDRQGKPRDYHFLEVNPAFEKLTGLKSGIVIGRTVLEILPATEPF
ncbi:MAG: PAS domain S-box protein, partial [Desulfatirhabdiaceae bacterium]